MIQKTLIILKPGCLQRGITGEIISRFEKKGLKIAAMKLVKLTEEKAGIHYAEHKDEPYYNYLIGYMTSSPVILMVVEGENAIMFARKLAGPTNLNDAEPGTIRGDYVMHTPKNIVHTSDSEESASREINNFFSKDEIVEYSRNFEEWIQN